MENNTMLEPANIEANLKRKHSSEVAEELPSVDQRGNTILSSGQVINEKYQLIKRIGKGCFGQVFRVVDLSADKKLALKISKKKTFSRNAAMEEIKTLRYIAREDRGRMSLCVELLDSFDYHGHVCMVFEELGTDVYHFMKSNDYVPFSIEAVRHIAYQLCYAVGFLHSQGIIHTDLKPDNILFVDSSYTEVYSVENNRKIRLINRTNIKLIDFGCAISDEKQGPFVISNRNYRAPEVVLRYLWSHPVDTFAIGCIIYELFTGKFLFNVQDDDMEHLAMMEKVLGPIPAHLAVRPEFFTDGTLNFDWRKAEEECHQPLETSMNCKSEDDFQLLDLLTKMLAYHPKRRITMDKALSHPFFIRPPSDQRANSAQQEYFWRPFE